jgi:hypothetical protein
LIEQPASAFTDVYHRKKSPIQLTLSVRGTGE